MQRAERAEKNVSNATASAALQAESQGASRRSQRNNSSGDTSQRTIRSFRPLPSGRAVVGALLVTLAALGAFVLTGREVEDLREPYFVAASNLAPGHVLTPDDVLPQLLDLPRELAASSLHQDAETDLVGAVVLGPVGAGELLQRAGLTPPGIDGQDTSAVEFSFTLPEGRAPRSLRAGEHVAMLSTTGRDENAITRVVVNDAVVTDFTFDDEGFGSTGDVVITLSISGSDDVLQAVNAAQATDVTVLRIPANGLLVLPSTSAIDAPSTGDTGDTEETEETEDAENAGDADAS